MTTTLRAKLATRLSARRRRGPAIARLTLDGRIACIHHGLGADAITRGDIDALVERGTNPHCVLCHRRWAR